MKTQPKALRLANRLEIEQAGPFLMDSAAAELRRLHEVEKQRDELLEALETLRYAYASHGNHAYCQVGIEEDLLKIVEAAIAKAERTTT